MNPVQYGREVAFALSIGWAIPDKLRLAAATLGFHLSNAGGATGQSAARKYRVHLGGQPHDLWLRTVGGDIFILHEVFGSGCYDIPIDMSKLKTIVDLGANIGLTTLYLATKAPEARFVCVEPAPHNIELLSRNIASVPRSIVIQAAVSNRSGMVLFDDTRPAWGGSISREGRLQVEAISIDELFARYIPDGPIDLLKIDIEGAEADVLSGPMPWLDRVRCIIAELHPPFTSDKFRRVMTRRGFAMVSDAIMPVALRAAPP